MLNFLMSIHVYIGTTEGPVAVQKLRRLRESVLMSSICLNGETKESSISRDYYNFVRPGVGLIADEFGDAVWRLDIAKDIMAGKSWQLPVYLAHWLHSQDRLGDGVPQGGDVVLWATGEVSIDKEVRKIDELPRKLQTSAELFQEWQDLGVAIIVLAPQENLLSLDAGERQNRPLLEYIGVGAIDHAVDTLRRRGTSAEESQSLASPASDDSRAKKKRSVRGAVAALLAIAVLAAFAWGLGYNMLRNDDVDAPSAVAATSTVSEIPVADGADVGDLALAEVPTLTATVADTQEACDELRPADRHDSSVPLAGPGEFAAFSLAGLCELTLATPPTVRSVVVVSLRRVWAVRAVEQGDGWAVPVVSARFFDREQAFLLFEQALDDAQFTALFSHLRELPGGELERAGVLEGELDALGLTAAVYRQRLLRASDSRDQE